MLSMRYEDFRVTCDSIIPVAPAYWLLLAISAARGRCELLLSALLTIPPTLLQCSHLI